MDSGTHIKPDRAMILIQKCIEVRFYLRSRIKKLFFSTPLWHFFDNPLCKNQKIRSIRSTRENIKKRHRNIEKKIRSLASGNVLTQGFFSPERKGKKNSAVSRKRRKRKFLQVSLLKKCKVGVRRDRTYKLCILSGKLDRLKSHILPSRGMLFI